MNECKSINLIVDNFTNPVGSSLNGDLEYYLNLLQDVDGPILDVNVGNGRFMIPLIKKGFTVHGVDNSLDKLKICENNCIRSNIKTNLYHRNLNDLNLNNKYEAIIMPAKRFCSITNKREMIKTLKSLKDHLTITGELILDLIFPTSFNKEKVTKLLELDNNLNIIHSRESIEIDIIKQESIFFNRYEKWINNKLISQEFSKETLKWYGVEEFVYILEDAGFTNIAYGYGYGTDINSVVTFRAERD